MAQQQFLDPIGLNQYNNSIATILKEKLATKADLSDVITIDYVNDNFVLKTTYNTDITDIVNQLSTKVDRNYSYSKSEINSLLGGYLPQPQSGTNYITDTYLTENGYATESWVNTNLTNTLLDYATKNWVSENYATQAWVLEQLPNFDEYYTSSQTDELLANYALQTVVNNLTSQITTLSSTVNNYIINGGSGESSSGSGDMVDLNNIYWWVHLNPGRLVFHSGQTLDENTEEHPTTPFERCFVSTDMYRRNNTLLPLEYYELRMSAQIFVNNKSCNIINIHQDFDSSTALSNYCDQTIKNYLNNELIINNDGILTSPLATIYTVPEWNSFILTFSSIYYRDINDGYNNHEGTLDPLDTWLQEDTAATWAADPDYTPVIYNESSLVGRYLYLYNKRRQASDSDIVHMLDDRLNYLNQFVKLDITDTQFNDLVPITIDMIHSMFEWLTIYSNVNISGTLNVSLWPFYRTDVTELDPSDATANSPRYSWIFNYKKNNWDDTASQKLEIRLYDNPQLEWSNTSNNIIKSIYDTSGYYDLLRQNNSSYLDSQRYISARTQVETQQSTSTCIITFGEGTNMVSITKDNFITMLNAYADRTSADVYKILLNGVELDPSDPTDLNDFISNYLINDGSVDVDIKIANIKLRHGQNLIYSYTKTYPTAHTMFDFVEDEANVKSLGGARGDITFNQNVTANEVTFSIDENNVMRGMISSIGDTNPVGSILIWAAPSAAPDGYLLCDGTNYPNDGTYSTLYSVIGNTYNDAYTPSGYFRIPDMSTLFTGNGGTLLNMKFIIKY